jgi:hypothetical protein
MPLSLPALVGRPLDYDGSDRGPCVAVPFPRAADHGVMHAAGWWLLRALARRAPVVEIALADLVATQDGVAVGTLDGMATTPPSDPPLIVRWRGVNYLNDGHHRATAAWLRGETRIAVRLLDLDAL